MFHPERINKFDDISALDWAILNALSDDYESIGLIYEDVLSTTNLKPSPIDVLDRITYMYQQQYIFLTQGQEYSKGKLKEEIENRTNDRKYWFGRTDSGSKAWQALTEKYEVITFRNERSSVL